MGHTGTYATGDLPSWSFGASLLANGESVNVESPTKSNDGAKAKSVESVVGVFNKDKQLYCVCPENMDLRI